MNEMKTSVAFSIPTLVSFPWAVTNTLARVLLSSKAHQFGVPVISVGNIVAGGVGKTEITALIANALVKRGKRVVIAMRGYGASPVWVRTFPNGGIATSFSDALALGFPDESLVLLKKVPGVVVAVGPNRLAVLKKHWEELAPDIVLLDDGFQHFKIARNLDVLVHDFNVSNPILRDFPRQLKTAGVRISFSEIPEVWKSFFKENQFPWVKVKYAAEGCYDSQERRTPLPKAALAFCGLGNPGRFRQFLNQSGVQIAGFKTFRDHYNYTEKDFLELIDWFKAKKKKTPELELLTTLKDYVKLQKWSSDLELKWVKIDLQFLSGEDLLWKAIDETLAVANS